MCILQLTVKLVVATRWYDTLGSTLELDMTMTNDVKFTKALSTLATIVAEFGDCRQKQRLSPNLATIVASVENCHVELSNKQLVSIGLHYYRGETGSKLGYQ